MQAPPSTLRGGDIGDDPARDKGLSLNSRKTLIDARRRLRRERKNLVHNSAGANQSVRGASGGTTGLAQLGPALTRDPVRENMDACGPCSGPVLPSGTDGLGHALTRRVVADA